MAKKYSLSEGNEHVSVDGTLLHAWASHDSPKRVDSKDKQAGPTYPSPPYQPCQGFGRPEKASGGKKKRVRGDFCRMNNCHNLVVDSRVTLADGYGERDAGCSASPEHNKQTRALGGPQRATKQDATHWIGLLRRAS